MPSVMVVLPTYNERENLPLMVDALMNLSVSGLRILVVDDGSPDGTGELADELAAQHPGRIVVLHRTQKEGLGPAYVAGFKHALTLDPEYIIQMDADFSHQPKYIQEMLTRLEEGYDLVIASRFAHGGGVDARWGIYRKLLSWFANRVYVPLLLNIPVTDATAGYRLWRRQTLIGIDLDRIRSNGYVFQVELAYVACRLGFRVEEIPIYFPDRVRGQSKMDFRITLEAALRVWQLLYRHRGLRPEMRRTEAYTV